MCSDLQGWIMGVLTVMSLVFKRRQIQKNNWVTIWRIWAHEYRLIDSHTPFWFQTPSINLRLQSKHYFGQTYWTSGLRENDTTITCPVCPANVLCKLQVVLCCRCKRENATAALRDFCLPVASSYVKDVQEVQTRQTSEHEFNLSSIFIHQPIFWRSPKLVTPPS